MNSFKMLVQCCFGTKFCSTNSTVKQHWTVISSGHSRSRSFSRPVHLAQNCSRLFYRPAHFHQQPFIIKIRQSTVHERDNREQTGFDEGQRYNVTMNGRGTGYTTVRARLLVKNERDLA